MKRRYILLLIIFLAIGFASISTTLVITGVIGIGTKNNDFKVIFTGAILDGIDKSNILISDDKIRIDYETEKLWKINDTSVLEFEVTNTSTQYDANVVLECDEINHEAIDFSISPSTMEIKPNEVKKGNITITLNRAVYTENIKINFSCRLKATAGEKTKAEVIEEINNLYNVSGNLQNKNGEPINSENLVVYSEKKFTKTDKVSGYFYVSGLEKGFHHIYKVPSELTEYEEEDIQEYMIAEIATNGYIKVYDENYKIVNYESSQDLEDNGHYCIYDAGKTWDFPYNGTSSKEGSAQEFHVEPGCAGTYKIELWGAQGATFVSNVGGYGSYTSGAIELSDNTSLYVYVGELGTDKSVSKSFGTYSFNGGGGSNYACYSFHNGTDAYNYYGGSATDIRYFEETPSNDDLKWNSMIGLKSRIMVAAGGSSGGQISAGSAGGGLNGYSGNNGTGGTQIDGGGPNKGSFGMAGIPPYNGSVCDDNIKFGSSSGYFGGGASNLTAGRTGNYTAGSGSSFISGHLGCVAIEKTSDNTITQRIASDETTKCTEALAKTDIECSKHYSGYVFTDTKMIDGNGNSWTNNVGAKELMPNPSGGNYTLGQGHTGNGAARITLISLD